MSKRIQTYKHLTHTNHLIYIWNQTTRTQIPERNRELLLADDGRRQAGRHRRSYMNSKDKIWMWNQTPFAICNAPKPPQTTPSQSTSSHSQFGDRQNKVKFVSLNVCTYNYIIINTRNCITISKYTLLYCIFCNNPDTISSEYNKKDNQERTLAYCFCDKIDLQ